MRRCQLAAETIRGIIHAVTSELLSHQEAAIRFNVKPALVATLVKSQKKDAKFVHSIAAKQGTRARELSLIVETTEELLHTQHNLWKASQIVDLLK